MTDAQRTFDIEAPRGFVILATLTGVQIRFAESQRPDVQKWIDLLGPAFKNQPTGQGVMRVTCPACGGKLHYRGELPDLCLLCKNTMYVTAEIAAEWISANGEYKGVTNEADKPIPEPTTEPPTQPSLEFYGPIYDPLQAGRPPAGGRCTESSDGACSGESCLSPTVSS